MKLIISSSELTRHFNALLNKYSKYYFATAWAGVPDKVFEQLLENAKHIEKLVVGIHFYQTDPAFFERFIGNENVRAVLQPDGTFHPKIFLFYDNDKKWTLLVGSGNFTNAAFTKNTEAVMMIESVEGSNDVLQAAMQLVNDSWKLSKCIDDKFLLAYKLKWAKMRARRKDLIEPIDKSILINGVTDFMKLSWAEYVKKFDGRRDIVNRRFEMLESIRSIFASGRSLINMSENERKFICGNRNDLGLPGADRHADFGTSGNGQFMNKMINGNVHYSNALDKIPLVGEVTEEHFNKFLAFFLQDPDTDIGWVSSAARLLAMKRPDIFYNITNANRSGFCEDFGDTQSHTRTLSNYWGLVVQKVQLCTWYNESNPGNGFERRLRETRVAMLDVLYYF